MALPARTSPGGTQPNYSGYLSNYYKKPAYNKDTYNQTQTAAPTTTAAPTNVNYDGAKDYGSYAAQNSSGMYGDYLKNEYADPTKLATNAKGETAYDLQRQSVTGDVEAERARQDEALKRKLAANGMQDSGMAFKQGRMLAKDLGEYGGKQKSNIAIEEMGARERQSTRLGEQAFSSEEAGKDRAESQRQFDSDQNLKVALQNNTQAMRAWTEGNKQAFDTRVEENKINKDDANRYWDTEMNEREIESGLSRDLAGQDFADVIAGRAEGRKAETEYYFTVGQIGSMTEDELAALKESNPNAWLAYKSGQEGKTLEETQNTNATKQNLIDSYIAASWDDPSVRATIRKAAIELGIDLPFANDGSGGVVWGQGGGGSNGGVGGVGGNDGGVPMTGEDAFLARYATIAGVTPDEARMGVKEIKQTADGSIEWKDINGVTHTAYSPTSQAYKEMVQNAKPYDIDMHYRSGPSDPGANGWVFDSLPEKGKTFRHGDKVYKVVGDPSFNSSTKSERVAVEDLSTGNSFSMNARWGSPKHGAPEYF